MIRRFITPLWPILFLATFISCTEQERIIHFPKTDLTTEPLIPKPLAINPTYSGFPLDQFTVLNVSGTKELDEVGSFLAKKISLKTGLKITTTPTGQNDVKSVINIELTGLESDNLEAYELRINEDSIILRANTETGAFRGIQTIRQLIPETSNDTLTSNPIWIIPTGTIVDEPLYAYRGTMLDVARHFFSLEEIKKYLDILSYYKINVFHLHLSDDQGWRIEIKSWPLLTKVGGSFEVGGGPGGFFTQEEFVEIVKYASERHITIVPEIDMPGHSNAASVSYPILNGNGKTPKPYTGMRVGFSTLDTRKDTVYTFIEDVVKEIAAISPGPYFHIGGDESHVTKKGDYRYFIRKVQSIVSKYGKRLIGWDEVANTDIDSSAIIQVWNNLANGNMAMNKAMRLILSPAHKAYLDMKYDSLSNFGLDWAGYIPVDSAYNWNPEGYFNPENVMGLEAPLWSETISNIDELEYLAFPRVIGYAELGWSTRQNRNWENYRTRLAEQAHFLERAQVNYYRSPKIDWEVQD